MSVSARIDGKLVRGVMGWDAWGYWPTDLLDATGLAMAVLGIALPPDRVIILLVFEQRLRLAGEAVLEARCCVGRRWLTTP